MAREPASVASFVLEKPIAQPANCADEGNGAIPDGRTDQLKG